MSARELTEQTPAPAPESTSRSHSEIGLGNSASLVFALQRSAGNAAVARYLAERGSPADYAGAAPNRSSPVVTPLARIQRVCEESRQQSTRGVHPGVATERVLARWPGDGMLPPGDCGWATYLPLRLSVESAKAVVNMVGACAPGDSCTFLATKIAAITAEIAARVALDTTCFRGGDEGHRQQVQDKINMMNRCYRFFQNSNCPQGLLTAMAAVVAAARAVIEAAAVAAAAAVVIAAVVALVVAIIALVEAIAAAAAAVAAAAAEAAAILAALAALAALLVVIKQHLSPETPSGA
jgi:Novel toxin 16